MQRLDLGGRRGCWLREDTDPDDESWEQEQREALDAWIEAALTPRASFEPNTGLPLDERDQRLKKDNGKLQIDLIPPEVIKAMATVLAFGAKKYARRAWESGELEVNRIWAAAQRHLWDYHAGKHVDDETGFPTLWHALTEVAFLVTYEARGFTGPSGSRG